MTTDAPRRIGITVAAVAAVAVPFAATPFLTFQLTMALIYAMAVLSIVLLTGMNGQIALGHNAFFGLGAYVTAVLVQTHRWNYLLTLPVAAVLCFLLGVLIGIPALRLRGPYLAILTLSIAVLFPLVIKRFDDVTGGSSGMTISRSRVAPPSWLGLPLENVQYLLALVLLAGMLLVSRNLLNGRVGRAITAIRDNEIPAATLGIDLSTVKTLTFGISAAFAGIAGCLYAVTTAFVSSDAFPVQMVINFLIGAVVGGLYSIYGAIVGGLVLEFLPEFSQALSPSFTALVYGGVLIVFLRVMPGGAAAVISTVTGRVRLLVSRRSGAAGVGPATPAGESST